MSKHTVDPVALATHLLFPDDKRTISRVCLVLGSPHHQELIAARMQAIWAKGGCNRFVVSGHMNEADQIAKLAVKIGMPASTIEVESKARNTPENIIYSASAVESGCETPPVVSILCKRYALPRTRMTIRTLMGHWQATFIPYFWRDVTQLNWLSDVEFVNNSAREFRKIATYVDNGTLSADHFIESGTHAAELANFLESRCPSRI